jgi:hypothetical protein
MTVSPTDRRLMTTPSEGHSTCPSVRAVSQPPAPIAPHEPDLELRLDAALAENAALRAERDALKHREAPFVSPPSGPQNTRGCVDVGRSVMLRTSMGEFDGRVIAKLPGGAMRVLWFDFEAVYSDEALVDVLQPRQRRSVHGTRIRAGSQYQAEVPSWATDPCTQESTATGSPETTRAKRHRA